MPLQKRYKYNYSSVYLTLPKCETLAKVVVRHAIRNFGKVDNEY
ncbi:hypothetical protein HMPREF9078_01203 [Capnocytophaga sp. oral taxon 380 str. F0488]|nr:hypothetical protein HMPREF9078_01203 [Capnocytophaga sp. oral taxon 380 str. F0488]